jgi:hypothetical protein
MTEKHNILRRVDLVFALITAIAFLVAFATGATLPFDNALSLKMVMLSIPLVTASVVAANYRICVRLQRAFPTLSFFAIFAIPWLVVSGFMFRESPVLLVGSVTTMLASAVFSVAVVAPATKDPRPSTATCRALAWVCPAAPILALALAFPTSSFARSVYLKKEWEGMQTAAEQALKTGSSSWAGGSSRKSGSAVFLQWSSLSSPRREVRFCYSPVASSSDLARLDGHWRVSPLRVGTSYPSHWYMLEGMPAWGK